MRQIAAYVSALLAALSLWVSPKPVMPPMPDAARLIPAHCERVVDGDTAWFSMVENGIWVSHSVRFLSIDTPETVHPDKPEQPGGAEASAYVRAVLEGQDVLLAYDEQRTDKYSRQLCHVWLEDGTLFNLHLVWAGYARVSVYAPNVQYRVFFEAAERYAKAHKLGVWALE